MFDSPNWLGSFITSRTNKDINELNRKHEVIMEDIKHKHEYMLQESRNKVTEDVARLNRESAEEIARLNRINEANINEARNKNAISVALINAASKTTTTALPYVLPAFLAGRASNKNNDNNHNSNKSQPTATVIKMTATESKAAENRKKADDLFPELEPTFGNSLMNQGVSLAPLNSNTLPKINVTQLVPAIGAVLSVAAPLLAII